MEMKIGTKIRELRLRDGRTQTETAEALGVSPQAVSRWEVGAAYPDLELVPSIANYFGVSIDNLFGYESEREVRINAIIKEANELSAYGNNRDVNIERRLTLLRGGLVEFPKNERLMYELAATLSTAGWIRLGEHICYDDDGYLVHKVETHLANEYWTESIKLFETILSESNDPKITSDSAHNLTLLYRNLGQYEKGLELAERMPPLAYSRELMRTYAVDGAEYNHCLGRALLKLMDEFAQTMVYTLMSKQSNFENDLAVRMLSGVIDMIETIFEDGKMGPYHALACDMLIYMSEHQYRCGLHDDAFLSLNRALEHAKTYDALVRSDTENPSYTTPLLAGLSMEREHWRTGDPIAPQLPHDWPMWMMPDFDDVKAEITNDPRWTDWVRRCRENG